MDKSARRCYSEHGASSKSKTSSLVPSHIATKIREIQLRQTSVNRLLQGDGKDIFSTSPFSTSRNLNSLNFPPRLPKILPSWRTTQTPARKQVDGADNLPSIDTIVADPDQDTDKNRNMAETEFYEHTDTDGVVRRRSMMRTVNRDDCLTGRGANPRTGLITPDVCSVAGSLDSITEPRQETKIPSAQWKLRDNQWVSEIQDEGKELHAEQQLPRFSEVNTQPLTMTNLRSLSHRLLGEELRPKLQSPSTEAILDVSKIRRKPVGSPSKVSNNSSEKQTRRSVSENTVVRTPPAVRSNSNGEEITSFFSPDNVKRVRGASGPHRPTRHQYDRLPFLDLPAKPYQKVGIQGFAEGRKNFMQLERSLRTNDGPYPFPPSIPQAITNRDIPRQGAFLPAVPRAYLSNLTEQHSVSQPTWLSQPETYQNRTLRQDRPVIACSSQAGVKEDHQSRHKNWESRKANLSTSAPSSTKRFYHRDTDQMLQDHSLLKHDILPGDGLVFPNGRIYTSQIPNRNDGGTSHIKNTVRRRPPLGPRNNGTISSSKMRSKLTHMEEKDRSNLIGMPTALSREDVAGRRAAEDIDDGLSCPTSIGSSMTPGISTKEVSAALDDNSYDHSTCCPRCCVEYDCHEGCSGHSSRSEVDKSETSRLFSMGVFEASFETTVEAVNDVLLTPQDKRGSALAKLRQVFIESLWQNSRSANREGNKQQSLKRTLRHPSPVRGSPIISRPPVIPTGPRHSNVKQAKAAAKRAMDPDAGITKQQSVDPKLAKVECSPVDSRKPSATVESISNKNGANEGRKISAATTASVPTRDDEALNLDDEAEESVAQIVDDVDSRSDVSESVVAKIGALVLHNGMSKSLPTIQPIILEYGPTLLLKSKDMVMVILETLTILSCVVCDYKRTGNVVLPDGVNAVELMGNCLRSLLYFMLALCLYALLVKISRAILCVLRILLLPVRLCAWVIG